MSTQALERGHDQDVDDDLVHVHCPCTPEWTLCGVETGDGPVMSDATEVTCVVCADLDDEPCARCGA